MCSGCSLIFLVIDMATPVIYTLSLHDALPILCLQVGARNAVQACVIATDSSSHPRTELESVAITQACTRSEEHTSELQSLTNLVCRLLPEKKNITASSTARDATCLPTCPSTSK